MLSKASPWKRATALRKTVMYSLGFADGRTGYVVVPQELVEHGDEDVPSLASTASDYGRLVCMFLNDGELDGARVLKA
jgi:hypothetical protein